MATPSPGPIAAARSPAAIRRTRPRICSPVQVRASCSKTGRFPAATRRSRTDRGYGSPGIGETFLDGDGQWLVMHRRQAPPVVEVLREVMDAGHLAVAVVPHHRVQVARVV